MRESAAVARNMSAPPRTKLTFAPLAPAKGASGDAVADGTGLAFVCRLDVCALLPDPRKRAFLTRLLCPEPEDVHARIRLVRAYAQAEAAGRTRLLPNALARAEAEPIESVADSLRDLLGTEALAGKELPRVGLLLPPQDADRTVLRSVRRTLAILARRRGTLFLRDADPIVWSTVGGHALDLWTPVAAGRAS